MVRVAKGPLAWVSISVILAVSTSNCGGGPQLEATFSADPIGAMLRGEPDAATEAGGAYLEKSISAPHLAYLASIDWSEMTPDRFVADPIVREAITVLANMSSTPKSASAGAAGKVTDLICHAPGLRPLNTGSGSCGQTKAIVQTGLETAIAKIVGGAAGGAVTCLGAVPSIGTSAPMCVVSFLAVASGIADLYGTTVAGLFGLALDGLVACAKADDCIDAQTQQAALAALIQACQDHDQVFDGCISCKDGTGGQGGAGGGPPCAPVTYSSSTYSCADSPDPAKCYCIGQDCYFGCVKQCDVDGQCSTGHVCQYGQCSP